MITLPAIKGQIGTTEYYLTSMSARELVSSVKPADELEEWCQDHLLHLESKFR